jgi:pSer/pThr/pTyr-binding forkhead associated (FHA) protein/S1-C subfamily serine protease
MPRIVLKDLDAERSHEVPETEASLGRDPSCSITIEGPKSRVVSARHARIFFRDGAWWIQDTSRNGTVLDHERLQAGQRHALKEGQVIGLGESGPRLKVLVLEIRKVAETVLEVADLVSPPPSTAARKSGGAAAPAPPSQARTAAIHRSETVRGGLKVEEPTEPMSPAPDWLVHVVLRATNMDVRFDVRAMVVKVGRSPDCDVQVPPELGAAVSRTHAEITIHEGGVVVRDAGSRNGTFVNGKRLEAPHPAVKNDLIMLGSGGPTFVIEDLHIVKGEASAAPSGAVAGSGTEAVTPPPKNKTPRGPSIRPIAEPPTAPSSGDRSLVLNRGRENARQARTLLWLGIAIAVVVAVALLLLTQRRIAESGATIDSTTARGQTTSDSSNVAAASEVDRLRAAFDSARSSSASRTAVDSLRNALADAMLRTLPPDQALARARESIRRQLAAAGSGPRAAELAPMIGTVRAANLAQVAQRNQAAVGMVVIYIMGQRVTTGSGFALTPSGYFVTNRHVIVDDAGRTHDTIYVTMADQQVSAVQRVEVVAMGRDVDIALLRIPNYRGPYVKRVDWQGSGARQGDAAVLIGFPYGVDIAVDDSSSVVRTSLSAGVFNRVASDRIQFDGFTVSASSGSPFFNARGEVVAVHRAGVSAGPGPGFSVPIALLVPLLPPDARHELGIR